MHPLAVSWIVQGPCKTLVCESCLGAAFKNERSRTPPLVAPAFFLSTMASNLNSASPAAKKAIITLNELITSDDVGERLWYRGVVDALV